MRCGQPGPGGKIVRAASAAGSSNMKRQRKDQLVVQDCQLPAWTPEAAAQFDLEDHRNLARLRVRVLKAIEKKDLKTICTVWQAVRGLALAVVHESEYGAVNIAAYSLEADLDNDLWGHAPRSVELFFQSLRGSIHRTHLRN